MVVRLKESMLPTCSPLVVVAGRGLDPPLACLLPPQSLQQGWLAPLAQATPCKHSRRLITAIV